MRLHHAEDPDTALRLGVMYHDLIHLDHTTTVPCTPRAHPSRHRMFPPSVTNLVALLEQSTSESALEWTDDNVKRVEYYESKTEGTRTYGRKGNSRGSER